MSYETRYAAMKRQRSAEYRESPKGREEARRLKEAMDCVKADIAKKYPVINGENIEEVEAYRQERVDFHRQRLNA